MHINVPRSSTRPLVECLRAEWSTLRTRPSVLRRVAEWKISGPVASLDDLLVGIGYRAERRPAHRQLVDHLTSAEESAAHDELTLALLRVARVDDLAARIVLQRLLPGLLACARRWPARRQGGSVEAFDELVAAAWVAIREFPFERRRHHVVASLLRDCEYRAFIRSSRRLLVHEFVEPHVLDVPCAEASGTEPLHELLELVREAAAVATITDHDRELLGLILSGRTTLEVAAQLGVCERTVRTHRAAMVERLRQVVGDVAA